MSFEQRSSNFSKAQTDMQMIYIEAERENKELREFIRTLYEWNFVEAADCGGCTNCPCLDECSSLNRCIFPDYAEKQIHKFNIKIKE